MFGIVLIINIVSMVANWGGNLQVGAIISFVAALWAFGIAANFGRERGAIPNYVALMSMVSGATGVVLAIAGFAS
jgi:hypothetical protein